MISLSPRWRKPALDKPDDPTWVIGYGEGDRVGGAYWFDGTQFLDKPRGAVVELEGWMYYPEVADFK